MYILFFYLVKLVLYEIRTNNVKYYVHNGKSDIYPVSHIAYRDEAVLHELTIK